MDARSFGLTQDPLLGESSKANIRNKNRNSALSTSMSGNKNVSAISIVWTTENISVEP